MQRGFYIDTNVCMGCYTCMAACKNWNNIAPQMTAEPGTQGPKWPAGHIGRVRRLSGCPNCECFALVHALWETCLHECVPRGAISKRGGWHRAGGQDQVHRVSFLRRSLPVWSASIRGGRRHGEMQLLPGPGPERTGARMCGECPPRALRAGTMDELSGWPVKRRRAGWLPPSDPFRLD